MLSGFNADGPEWDPEVPPGEGKRAVIALVGMVVTYSVSMPSGAGKGDEAAVQSPIPVVLVNFTAHQGVVFAPADSEEGIRNTLFMSPVDVTVDRTKKAGWKLKVTALAYSHGTFVTTDESMEAVRYHGTFSAEDVVEVTGLVHVGWTRGMPGDPGTSSPNGNKTTMMSGGGVPARFMVEVRVRVAPHVIQVCEFPFHHQYERTGHNHCTSNTRVGTGWGQTIAAEEYAVYYCCSVVPHEESPRDAEGADAYIVFNGKYQSNHRSMIAITDFDVMGMDKDVACQCSEVRNAESCLSRKFTYSQLAPRDVLCHENGASEWSPGTGSRSLSGFRASDGDAERTANETKGRPRGQSIGTRCMI